MDYQFLGFVFACIAVVMSLAYLGLGFSAVRFLRKRDK